MKIERQFKHCYPICLCKISNIDALKFATKVIGTLYLSFGVSVCLSVWAKCSAAAAHVVNLVAMTLLLLPLSLYCLLCSAQCSVFQIDSPGGDC